MHELSITTTIVKMLEDECIQNDISNPKEIILEVGKFTTYSGESINMFFEILKKDSQILKGSILSIEEIEGKVECNQCGMSSIIEDPIMIFCMNCKSNDVNVISGKELNIKSIVD